MMRGAGMWSLTAIGRYLEPEATVRMTADLSKRCPEARV